MPCTNGVKLDEMFNVMWHWHCTDDRELTIDGISGLTLVPPVGAFVSRCYGQPSLIRGNPRGDKAPPETDTRIS